VAYQGEKAFRLRQEAGNSVRKLKKLDLAKNTACKNAKLATSGPLSLIHANNVAEPPEHKMDEQVIVTRCGDWTCVCPAVPTHYPDCFVVWGWVGLLILSAVSVVFFVWIIRFVCFRVPASKNVADIPWIVMIAIAAICYVVWLLPKAR
jgi:hypothetical protein